MKQKMSLLWYFVIDSFCLMFRKVPFILRMLNTHSYYTTDERGNNEILRLLKSNQPFLVGRLGHAESVVAGAALMIDKMRVGKWFFDRIKHKIYENEEFWPVNDQLVLEFGRMFSDKIREFDVYVCWNIFLERYFSKYIARQDIATVDFYALEPFCYADPWSGGLKGKKVLVICPYPKTVQRQYEKRKLLWYDKRILPDFELSVLKSVYGRQSAPGCATWFDALDKMYNEAMRIEFDVAILACGPFAVPLGGRFKRAGRSAIIMCGVTQILFGIKGKRWDDRPYVSKFYNEHWVRLDQQELPDFAKKVEKGCYL